MIHLSIHVQLEQFEGPMGLLLYLIKKEEMDISNIQIHKITSQYLDYIKVMRNFDLEVAGDFVAMAATLIHIKSRMLLPNYNDAGEVVEDGDDPRKELVNRLLEYQKYQEASKKLNELSLLGRDVFARGMKEAYEAGVEEIVLEDNALYQMISLYRIALMKMKKRVHKVYAKGQSIASRIMEIKDRIVFGKQTELRALLIGEEQTRTKLLITFLSLLELTRLGFISIFQSTNYGEIFIDANCEIERDVVTRVQEYDTKDANLVANSWIASAEATDSTENNIDSEEVVVLASQPQAVSVIDTDLETSLGRASEVDVPQVAPIAESQIASSDTERLDSTWEDEVVDQLADLSEDEFETLLNDQVLTPLPSVSLEFSDMSTALELQLDGRTAEIAAEEAASLTEYASDQIGEDYRAEFSYEGTLEPFAVVEALAAEPSPGPLLASIEAATSPSIPALEVVPSGSTDDSDSLTPPNPEVST